MTNRSKHPLPLNDRDTRQLAKWMAHCARVNGEVRLGQQLAFRLVATLEWWLEDGKVQVAEPAP